MLQSHGPRDKEEVYENISSNSALLTYLSRFSVEVQTLYVDKSFNIIIYFYCTKDLPGAIRRVSSFLQCPLVEEEVNKSVQHCSFASMKNNNMVNYTLIDHEIMDHSKGSFMRNGEAMTILK